MRKIWTGQNRLTVLYLMLYAIAMCLWFVDNAAHGRIWGYVEGLLYISLMLAWAYSIHIRLLQNGLRHYLIAMTAMLAAWFLLRFAKYFIAAPNTDFARYLWYLYYLPMMFYPIFAVMATCFIGKNDDYALPKKTRWLYVVSGALLLLVLTNDLHQWVFVFPEEAVVYSDAQYTYGLGFFLIFAWFLLSTFAVFFQIFCKCRLPGREHLVIGPILPVGLGLLYHLAYTTGHAGFFTDLISVMSLLTIASFELSIRTGLIRSNSNYAVLFRASTLSAEIADENLDVTYAAGRAGPMDRALLKKAAEAHTVEQGNTRICSAPIQGGYVFWQEDISTLQKTLGELSSVQEELKSYGSLLEEETTQKKRRLRLAEQEAIYAEIQAKTAPQLTTISRLSAALQAAEDVASAQKLLWHMAVIGAYLKRKSNLILLGHKVSRIPPEELELCLKESVNQLRLRLDACAVRFDLKAPLSPEDAGILYDFFEAVVELSLDTMSGITILLNESERDYRTTILAQCDSTLSALSGQFSGAAFLREEGTWFCTWTRCKGGATQP